MLGPIPILAGSDPKSALLKIRNCPGHIGSLGNGIQTWIGNHREDVKREASELADVCKLI